MRILSARVFISCGQRPDELTIAEEVASELINRNFEPYIARKQQTLRGIKENIFSKLAESEYFIFIDFRRERLSIPGEVFRGSLFSHQELAIATFLEDAEVLAFQEMGVNPQDGILRYIQANCIPFSDRKELPDLVAKNIDDRGWISTWRNEIELTRNNDNFEVSTLRDGTGATFFHIKVKNNHKSKLAQNCQGFIERIENIQEGSVKELELAEFKWKGVSTASVNIPPKKYRYLDAFHIRDTSQRLAYLGINPYIIDYGGVYSEYRLTGNFTYILSFVIFSNNFSPSRAKFRLQLGETTNQVKFEREWLKN